MKILFIIPKIGSQAKWLVGVAYLSAILKKSGYRVELLEIEDKKEINQVNSFIQSYQPQIIGISANSHQFFYAVKIAKIIKSEFSIPVFLGGVHSTIRPDEAIKEKYFNGVCIGEAEGSILELVRRIEQKKDYTNVNNFWFRKGNQIIKNKINPLLINLDKLPFPDYSIFKYFKNVSQKEVTPRFIFSRGCPFDCTYCCNHVFKRIYYG